jgi:LmbE family N-acetylglucosaminyl deacetylase
MSLKPRYNQCYSDSLRAGLTRFDSRERNIVLFSGAHPAPYPVGIGPLSRRVRRQGHEADLSPLSSAEAKSSGALPSLPHVSSWHIAQLIKRRNRFTFL